MRQKQPFIVNLSHFFTSVNEILLHVLWKCCCLLSMACSCVIGDSFLYKNDNFVSFVVPSAYFNVNRVGNTKFYVPNLLFRHTFENKNKKGCPYHTTYLTCLLDKNNWRVKIRCFYYTLKYSSRTPFPL